MNDRLLAAGVLVGALAAAVVAQGAWVAWRGAEGEGAGRRRALVEATGLTDLALATGSVAVRHRSLSDFDSLFGDDPELPGYQPASLVYAPPLAALPTAAPLQGLVREAEGTRATLEGAAGRDDGSSREPGAAETQAVPETVPARAVDVAAERQAP